MTQNKSKKTAIMKAVDFLAARDYPRMKLAEKLIRAGYADTEVEEALDRLVDKGYLNDAALCEREFMRMFEAKRDSLRQIRAKLQRSGFKSEIIKACSYMRIVTYNNGFISSLRQFFG